MAIVEKKLWMAEPADPDRCQGSGSGGEGQCRFLSMKGMSRDNRFDELDETDYSNSTNCPKHGGVIQSQALARERVHDYKLQVWQERMTEFSESDRVKTLRGEIGITRLMTETILNRCETPQDLVMYSSKISDLVMKTEKLVSSCAKMESTMGMFMDRAAALLLAASVTASITKHIREPAVVEAISHEIIDAFSVATGDVDGE